MSEATGPAQYDGIAADYQRTKEAPLRRYVEAYSYMQLLGDVRGLSVLDLACGEGYYSRRIRAAGAAHVTGIDVSAEMIALAQQEERRHGLGIDYQVADVATMATTEKYSLVSAAYLLHYAPDVNVLRTMCARIADCLRPGGRFVAINENPEQSEAPEPGYAQYGFDKRFAQPRRDGSLIDYSMVSGRQLMRFSVWYYTRDTYESALRDAGFSTVSWLPLQLDAAGIDEYGAEYWQAYMNNPPVLCLEAVL